MRVAELWTYPVKSCVGVPAAAIDLDDHGVVGDREYVVTTPDGSLFTQRNAPVLNMVRVERTGDVLRLSAPGRPPLAIAASPEGPRVDVILYDGPAPGACMGGTVADWLTATIGKPCRLVRSDAVFARRMAPVVAHLFLPEQRRFPDCAPLHVIGRASLDALNRRLPAPVEMSRFRPNLVVDGVEAFGEDRAGKLRIGGMTLAFMGVAERCAIPSIAPGSIRRGQEPLRALRGFRMLEEGFYTKIAFGAYFRPLDVGRIELGQQIERLEERAAPPLRPADAQVAMAHAAGEGY